MDNVVRSHRVQNIRVITDLTASVDATAEEIRAAAMASVSSLPEGIESVVRPDGAQAVATCDGRVEREELL